MKHWTPLEWENLEKLSKRLQQILETRERDQENRAWQAKLRITISTIAMFQDQEEK